MSVSLIDGHIDGKTNYDRIRNMSVKELAKFLNEYIPPYRLPKQVREIYNNNSVSFYGAWLLWLESEVAE